MLQGWISFDIFEGRSTRYEMCTQALQMNDEIVDMCMLLDYERQDLWVGKPWVLVLGHFSLFEEIRCLVSVLCHLFHSHGDSTTDVFSPKRIEQTWRIS